MFTNGLTFHQTWQLEKRGYCFEPKKYRFMKPLDQIMKETCNKLGLSPGEVKKRSKKPHNVKAREVFSCTAWNEGHTLHQIGDYLGFNHTAILYLIHKDGTTRQKSKYSKRNHVDDLPSNNLSDHWDIAFNFLKYAP